MSQDSRVCTITEWRVHKEKKIPLIYPWQCFSTNYNGAEQITEIIIQMENRNVENPNWLEANKLAIYKLSRGFELGQALKQIQTMVRVEVKPETSALGAQRTDHSATLPHTEKALNLVSLISRQKAGKLLLSKNRRRKQGVALVANLYSFGTVKSVVGICHSLSPVQQRRYQKSLS